MLYPQRFDIFFSPSSLRATAIVANNLLRHDNVILLEFARQAELNFDGAAISHIGPKATES